MRDELIAANIVTKIEGSGINGRPAFYTINVEIRDAQEQPAESVEDFVVEDSADVPAVEEAAPREHVDTDELLDENVVRAFTAKAGRGGFGGGGKRDAQRRAQQERFRRAVAQKGETDAEAVENEVAAESQRPAKEQKPVEAQEPQCRRGAHFKAAQQDVAHEVEEPSEAADDVEESAKKAPGSCRPGRGFARRAYPVRRQEKGEPASTAQAEKAEQTEKTVEPAAREQQPSESQPAADTEVKAQQTADKQAGESASGKPRRRRHRGGRGSNAEAAAEKTATQNGDEKAETPVDQVKRQPAKDAKSDRPQKRPFAPKQERNTRADSKRKPLMHRLSLPRLIVLPSSPSRPSTARYRRLPLPAFWAGSCSKLSLRLRRSLRSRSSRLKLLRSRARTAKRRRSALSTTRCPTARLPRKSQSSRLGSSKTEVPIRRLPRAASVPTRFLTTRRLLTASTASV